MENIRITKKEEQKSIKDNYNIMESSNSFITKINQICETYFTFLLIYLNST